MTVHFQDGYSATATVLGSDASTDVGVIKVNVPASELHPIAFANSSDARVGDSVVAIMLQPTYGGKADWSSRISWRAGQAAARSSLPASLITKPFAPFTLRASWKILSPCSAT